LQKQGIHNIIRPKWIFDCINQCRADAALPEFLTPLEPGHIFFAPEDNETGTLENVDRFSDSFARNTTIEELKNTLEGMKVTPSEKKSGQDLKKRLLSHDQDMESLSGWMFKGFTFYFDDFHQEQANGTASDAVESSFVPNLRTKQASITARFAGASISDSLKDKNITHVIAGTSTDLKVIREILKWYVISMILNLALVHLDRRQVLPRIVNVKFIEECWKEKTLLDEEREYKLTNLGISINNLLQALRHSKLRKVAMTVSLSWLSWLLLGSI
jgi:DNA ligase-4